MCRDVPASAPSPESNAAPMMQVVVHATRSTSFPTGEVAAIREHTRSPIVILASGESTQLLDEALDAEGVADVLLLPQLT